MIQPSFALSGSDRTYKGLKPPYPHPLQPHREGGSDRTYKGLKRTFFIPPPYLLSRSDRTYKGLKHGMAGRWGLHLFRSDRTYKGLKLREGDRDPAPRKEFRPYL